MKLKTLFTLSAVTTALMLAGCGGDISIHEGNIDNSVTDSNNTTNNNNGGGSDNGNGNTDGGANLSDLPGVNNQELAGQVSAATGTEVIVQVLNSSVVEDTTLVATFDGKPVMYAISGAVTVGGAQTGNRFAPATLSIEPGVVLFGRSGADYLAVHRDSKIMAEGTAANPIIMTSLEDVLGQTTTAGQWGGVVILGNAPSNKCPAEGECALQIEGAAEGAVFGGSNWEDNSGVLKYVVVKYAGFEIAPDNELNGITFGGVGSGTTVEYVQVHANADDGVEFFGGAVNVKHLVLTGNKDDSVDWDNGFQGNLQYVYVEHDKNAGEANRAIEGDNDGSDPAKTPQSLPVISNMTVIGNNYDTDNKDSEGIYLREGTGAHLYNIAITGPSEMGECFEIENSDVTQQNAVDGVIKIEHSALACNNDENFKNITEQWFLGQAGNMVSTSIMLGADGAPLAGSPLLGAGKDVAADLGGDFFEATDFIGAVGSNDWRQGWAFGFGGGEVTANPVEEGCPTGTAAITSIDGATTTCQISGTITSDLTLTAGNYYALSGAVFVGNDNDGSATLTIPAGVTVFGREGEDYLVVRRGSKIEANGTAAAPVTFTSSQDVMGEATGAGQWGGIVILGNAHSNKCPADGGCAIQVEGVDGEAVFGGTNSEDNSGTLRYVVVKHAGFEIAPDNELNGITFAGVGSNTTVEYIQVHDNADDGVEFFGGSVSAKYVVLTDNRDDSVDWDNGFNGNLQYVLVRHNPENGEANRAIEGDNDGSDPSKQPQSQPTISNMTVIANGYDTDNKDSEGVYLREGTLANLSNFVITGAAESGECFEIENTDYNNANRDAFAINITNSVIACSENFKNVDDAWWTGQAGNAVAADKAAVVDGVFTIFADAQPKDWSAVEGNTFFDNASHIGAVSADNNWTAGWAVGLE